MARTTTRKRKSTATAIAHAGGPWYGPEAQTEGDSAQSPEWALWQSVEPLRQAVLASAPVADAACDVSPMLALLELPRDLLRPLDALPRPLNLDEVVKAGSNPASARGAQAKINSRD